MKDYSYLSIKELINNVELQNDPLAKMLLDRLDHCMVHKEYYKNSCNNHDDFIEEVEHELSVSQSNVVILKRDLAYSLMKYDDLSTYILEGYYK